MRHPVRSDFHTGVTEASISVTFKPTNSTYSFHRLTVANDLARPSRSRASNTQGGILRIILPMKLKKWRGKLRQNTPGPFG